VIARGYAVLTDRESGTVVNSVQGISTGDRLQAQLSDGSLDCIVEKTRRTRD
jgi:exonuclease VII large subunit